MKMRNKIACSAERLGLLDPQMIQSVADSNAFHIGRQYLTENRVRIVEADDAQISSAVIGNSGLYEQTIRLKDGHLISKCSCTLPEEPMCRHCIAVLLEYHRWSKPRPTQKTKAAKVADAPPHLDSSGNQKLPSKQRSAPDIKLGEIMMFVEWLEPAMAAMEQSGVLPDSPSLGPGEVSTWIHKIRNLEDRRREQEELLANLQSEIRDREAYLGRLSQQLQASIAEAKSAQATSQSLQREIVGYKETLGRVTELMDKVVRSEGEIRSVASDLLTKITHLDTLTASSQELTNSLKSASKPPPLK
ncbi:MAG: hypothetical protein OEY28_11615 [Nitrospira sp.]|nr:hypothetical protein [Nitrospira sp.]